ncbi:hypothetical protein [Neorhizobium sp. NCHU2750]|uniref:hypothetical protein n=1 Tax=Neorhizobium sp. NCHU2750 TaxID=1825976 RepID=UPI000E74D578|nr:hypothetical protein NCHU2750_21140 [Neorhizobium sp. NCHU2750]
MKKAFAFAFIATTVLAGGAYARDLPKTSAKTDFSIVYTDPTDYSENKLTVPVEYADPTPEMVQKAQAELHQQPVLQKELRADDVELGNVVGIDKAGDGSEIVYVR